jgi:hypothetical protein
MPIFNFSKSIKTIGTTDYIIEIQNWNVLNKLHFVAAGNV